jgi:hypothetical protein
MIILVYHLFLSSLNYGWDLTGKGKVYPKKSNRLPFLLVYPIFMLWGLRLTTEICRHRMKGGHNQLCIYHDAFGFCEQFKIVFNLAVDRLEGTSIENYPEVYTFSISPSLYCSIP